MSSILLYLPEIYDSYKTWVSQNPIIASDYETTAKWVSYFIAGRINNSHIVSELVYSLSNLLVLFNDRIIKQLRQLECPGSGDRLKLWLCVIEYSEVFLELSANKLWGKTGRWLIIVAVQVFKCVSRLILLYQHKESMISNPTIPVLQRREVLAPNPTDFTFDCVSFTLKRTGKVMRKVDSSPPIYSRTWKPVEENAHCDNKQTIEEGLAGVRLVAETLYVAKPIVHLASVGLWGNNTWKPWMASLLLDLASLHLHRKQKNMSLLTKKQKLIVSKRTLMLLMYLLRSPFYDRYSKDRIAALLKSLSKSVPLAGIICNPLVQYLPFWQGNYFYMWST